MWMISCEWIYIHYVHSPSVAKSTTSFPSVTCWDKIFIIKSFWSTQCLKILLNKLYWCGFKMFFIRRLQSCCLNLQCTSEKPRHLFSLNYRSLSYIYMFTCNRSKEIKKFFKQKWVQALNNCLVLYDVGAGNSCSLWRIPIRADFRLFLRECTPWESHARAQGKCEKEGAAKKPP